MARTSQQFRWNWVYQFFRQVSWRFYRWSSAVFLACFRLGEGLFCSKVQVSPLTLYLFYRAALNAAKRNYQFSYICPLTILLALVIKYFCFALRTFCLRDLLKCWFRPRTRWYFFLFWLWRPFFITVGKETRARRRW